MLGYKHGHIVKVEPTMQNIIYHNLSRQYDPLGFIIPFTTQAKILVQKLWDKKKCGMILNYLLLSDMDEGGKLRTNQDCNSTEKQQRHCEVLI